MIAWLMFGLCLAAVSAMLWQTRQKHRAVEAKDDAAEDLTRAQHELTITARDMVSLRAALAQAQIDTRKEKEQAASQWAERLEKADHIARAKLAAAAKLNDDLLNINNEQAALLEKVEKDTAYWKQQCEQERAAKTAEDPVTKPRK